MRDFLERLDKAEGLPEIKSLIDNVLEQVRSGQARMEERCRFLRSLAFHPVMIGSETLAQVFPYLFSQIPPAEWNELFGEAVEKELPRLMVDLVDGMLDVSHQLLLRFVPDGACKPLLASLKSLDSFLQRLEGSPRLLRGMRVARIMVDVYALLARQPRVFKRRTVPSCCIDSDQIVALKEGKKIDQLPAAYETRINQLQRMDLKLCLAAVAQKADASPHMHEEDYRKVFVVQAPLRLGISSANASDNHLRSKEQGARTLNAGIDLQVTGQEEVAPPLRVTARRLSEPKLLLRSLSQDFKADFEASNRGDAHTQSDLFFAYRRGGDAALRLVKQALVHTGIVRDNSEDVIRDIAEFTGGGGLEVITESQVLQGSGLGTSSILSAAILKSLYRLCRHEFSTPEHEYPALYDQSLLLEQSIGLNSGWQDARGACGGESAVKDFYAPPTDGLPAPELTFITEVDEEEFTERVILFDTGIARAATRGLNVVLDAYLTRDPARYPAIRESLVLHQEMVQALRAGDYSALGALATRYWRLRCTLDPEATNPSLQILFEDDAFTEVSAGGLITGAGGGGFALLICRDGSGEDLRHRLGRLRKNPAYARSQVVTYRLDRRGLRLSDESNEGSPQ